MQPIFGIVRNGTIGLNSVITAEMDRRTKDRHDLRLLCHVGKPKAGRKAAGSPTESTLAGFISAEVESLTENMSRDGMLMRWLDEVPLPELGASLTVEIDLPAGPDFGPRVMKCAGTVVRITGRPGTKRSVGLRLEKVRFTKATKRRQIDLVLMPVASDRVN
jgi:hypothetical protein